MPGVFADSSSSDALLAQAAAGNVAAFRQLIERYEPAIRQLIRLRLGNDLAARLDVSDVLQETHLIVYRRLADFLRRRPMPFALWLQRTALEQLADVRRRHVDSQRRSVSRECPWPESSSAELFGSLFASTGTPSGQVMIREEIERLHQSLQQLAKADREILLMRYVERLSNQEAAVVLGISEKAASKRHGAALLKLHRIMKRPSTQDR